MCSWLFFCHTESGSLCTILTLRFGLNSIALQGTKVLEDREIRLDFIRCAEGAPPQHACPRIIKYTGALAEPEWYDVEPGRVFTFPWYLVEGAQSPKDKFETLCGVKADISSAPYTSKLAETGKMGYKRRCDVILLVGLTELEAQVGWIDSRTVRGHIIPAYPFISSHFHV